MPVFVVAAPCGGAGMAVSQALAHSASASMRPSVLLDVRNDPIGPRRAALFPSVTASAKKAAAAIAERDRSAFTVAHLAEPDGESLSLVLPLADGIIVPGTRFGDLDAAAALYRMISSLRLESSSGRQPQPWLLPSGWACRKNPGVRLHGWRRQLEQRTSADGLRCLPLVFPWIHTGSFLTVNPALVEAVGAVLLGHLEEIAAGRAPSRPPDGLAGGDPWPDEPKASPFRPTIHFPGMPRLRLVHSA